jgi:hypothetical protein
VLLCVHPLLAFVILHGSTINPAMEAMINFEDRAERVRQITEGNHGRVTARAAAMSWKSTTFK